MCGGGKGQSLPHCSRHYIYTERKQIISAVKPTTYLSSTFLNGLNTKAKITLVVLMCESVYVTTAYKCGLGPVLINLTSKIIKNQSYILKKTHCKVVTKETASIGSYSSGIYILYT